MACLDFRERPITRTPSLPPPLVDAVLAVLSDQRLVSQCSPLLWCSDAHDVATSARSGVSLRRSGLSQDAKKASMASRMMNPTLRRSEAARRRTASTWLFGIRTVTLVCA